MRYYHCQICTQVSEEADLLADPKPSDEWCDRDYSCPHCGSIDVYLIKIVGDGKAIRSERLALIFIIIFILVPILLAAISCFWK